MKKGSKIAVLVLAGVFGVAAAGFGAAVVDTGLVTHENTVNIVGGFYSGGKLGIAEVMNQQNHIVMYDNLTGKDLSPGLYKVEIGCGGQKAIGLVSNECIVKAESTPVLNP
jgi:hypothetical protein